MYEFGKRYQVENSQKLKEKWADEFKKQCVNDGNPNPFRARERSQGKKVILVVDHYVPTFDKDAGSKTTYQYLKMFLKKGYVVMKSHILPLFSRWELRSFMGITGLPVFGTG